MSAAPRYDDDGYYRHNQLFNDMNRRLAEEKRQQQGMGYRLGVAAAQMQKPDVFVAWCVEFCEQRIPGVVIVEERHWLPEMKCLADMWEFIIMPGERTVALVATIGPDADTWERNRLWEVAP